jgi:hypothetical protein
MAHPFSQKSDGLWAKESNQTDYKFIISPKEMVEVRLDQSLLVHDFTSEFKMSAGTKIKYSIKIEQFKSA